MNTLFIIMMVFVPGGYSTHTYTIDGFTSMAQCHKNEPAIQQAANVLYAPGFPYGEAGTRTVCVEMVK